MADESQPPERAGGLGGLAARARRAAQTLKQEYEAGKLGDQTTATPIWATAGEQLDAAVQLVRRAAQRTAGPATSESTGATPAPGSAATAEPAADAARVDAPAADAAAADTATADATAEDVAAEDVAADEVVGALRRVDWSRVRSATADRSGDAARAARTLAAQVDWDRVQPAARRMSAALIGAVATGQLGLGGSIGPLVARAIVDQGGLGRRVEDRFAGQPDAPPTDLGGFIETTGRDATEGAPEGGTR